MLLTKNHHVIESVKEIVLEHNCPVCHTRTMEVYEKSTHELSVHRGKVESYVFKEMMFGSNMFERLRIDNKNYISCPKCGTVLNAGICEQEMSVEAAEWKYSGT